MTPNANDPAQLFDEVRRRGVSIAGRVADEFIRLIPPVPGAPDAATSTGSDTDGGGGDDERDLATILREAQVQAERAVDAALDAVTGAFSAMAQLVAKAGHLAAPDPSSPAGLAVTVAAGQPGTCRCWLHNTTDSAAPPVRIHVGELRSNAGALLGAAVRADPNEFAGLAARTSAEVVLGITTPPDAAPGRFFGLVHVDGLPQPPLLLSVTVERSQTGAP